MFKNVHLLFLNLAGQISPECSFMFKNVQECLIKHVFKKDAALPLIHPISVISISGY